MKILILGGTRFVGRAIAEAALAAGHEITLFNRGQTDADLFPNAEKLQGDRDGDLTALEGGRWDAVIDTCGYLPRVVRASAELLKDAVDHYVFISTISVYDASIYSHENSTEEAPLSTMEDESVEEINGETYGPLKVLCEHAVDEVMGGRALNVRCGLIIGPTDYTDRFTYWPIRTARGGEMLAPPADAPSQVIDVRDLARWVVKATEDRLTGAYNATGPDYGLSYGRTLEACKAAAGTNAATVYFASEEFLLDNEVREWVDLPLWLPTSHAGMNKVSVDKAIKAGLTYRSIEETVADTLAWYKNTRGLDSPLRAGIAAEREAELIAQWKAHQA